MSGMGSKSLTRRIKVVKQVLKYAGDLRMHVQQMGDGGTPLGGVGNPSDTHILNNPPPSRWGPGADSLRWGDFAFLRAAQFPQTL